MRHRVTAGRRPRPSVSDRRRKLRSELTAAAAPMLTTYDMVLGSPAGRHFYESALAAGLTEFAADEWPCEVATLDGAGAEFHDGSHCAIWRAADGTLVYASLHGGWFRVQAASSDLATAYAACLSFRDSYPASYLTVTDDPRVAITFWSMGPYGPQSRLRRIEASPWEPIADNYTAEVRDELGKVMNWHDGPGADGQLMLWQGPPGTGKTWALRALASEWAPWAEFHYITDPDSFFVDVPSYMIDVLLSDSYDVIEPDTGDIYDEQDPEGKWRVLILEDTGELLSVNAKEKYGQGLSRLLNVVDGMIGQGLRVMCLVTTNDELGELTPAVKRPGRCASQLVFGPLSEDESVAWLAAREFMDDSVVQGPMTAAELFATIDAAAEPLPDDLDPEQVDEFVASLREAFRQPITLTAGAVVAETEKGREIGDVAARHAPDGGYGETAWNAEDGVVYWVSADWSTDDEVDAAAADFLDVAGVDAFEYEAEAALPEGDEWEVVYRSGADEYAALADLVRLAAEPLQDPHEYAVAARQERQADGPMERALAVIADAHKHTVEALLAQTAREDTRVAAAVEERASRHLDRALDVLGEFARRPDPPAQPIHVHTPRHDLNVRVESPTVEVDVPSPYVEVVLPATHPSPAPNVQVDVHVPEQERQEPPRIDVHVPAQPRPVVQVAAATPPPRAVRVAKDEETGETWFIPEGAEEPA